MDKKEQNKAYYEKNREALLEKRRQRYSNNKEVAQEYYKKNKKKISDQKRVYRENNKENIKFARQAYYLLYRDEIRDRKRAQYRKRAIRLANERWMNGNPKKRRTKLDHPWCGKSFRLVI